jgi:dipeptidyl aminopeptidase/acylaminoacyl peptidase
VTLKNTVFLVFTILVLLVIECPANAQSYGLYTMSVDGASFKQITKFDAKVSTITKVSFSPDGSTLVMSLIKEKHSKMLLIRTDGSNLKELTTENSADSALPVFTRDGKKILFSSPDLEGQVNLYLMNVDGTGKELFKRDASEGEYNSDGSKLIFQRMPTVNKPDEIPSSQIFICNADGSGDEALTNELHTWYWRASFNPANPTEILVAALRTGKDFTIETVNTTHSGGKTLFTSYQLQPAARFTPDGRQILYAAAERPFDLTSLGQPDRSINLYRINFDGSGAKKLTNADGYSGFAEPAISPDGKTIVFIGVELRH